MKLPAFAPTISLLTFVAACHPHRLMTLPYAPAPSPGLRAGSSFGTQADSFYGALADSIFGALGLPSLSRVILPESCEEVRINVGNGPARGSEAAALRLIRCAGHVTGEVATFRFVIDARYPCVWPEHGHLCVGRGRFSATPTWPRFWSLLDTLDIWDLPPLRDVRARYGDYITSTHAGHLQVEWLRAGEYRSWLYVGFEDHAWPEALKASALERAFWQMERNLVHTPSNLIHQYPP